MYKVVNKFADSLDNDFVYKVGDVYPREGFEPSIFRLEQLSEFIHALGGPAIKKVEDGDIVDVVKLKQLTNDELMDLLDAKGIKYNKKARNEELIELLK